MKLTPPTDYVRLDIRGTTVAEGSSDTLSVDREHGTNTITVSGGIPVGASATEEWTSVWEPTGYAASVFADALAGTAYASRAAPLGRATRRTRSRSPRTAPCRSRSCCSRS